MGKSAAAPATKKNTPAKGKTAGKKAPAATAKAGKTAATASAGTAMGTKKTAKK